jgi:hypothetical protein
MTKRHAKLIQTMRVNAEASEETDEIDDLSSTNLVCQFFVAKFFQPIFLAP